MTDASAKRWHIAPPAPPDFIDTMRPLHHIVAQVLYNRGHTDPAAAHDFLATRYALPWPFHMKDMGKAVDRIIQAIARREPIAVYGDFDVDGVSSTALLTLVLRALDADVQPYIPDRIDEGYGLNSQSLLQLAGQNIKLVITVDCGIRSVQEVAEANAVGMDVIITDHHSVGPKLPSAHAVIDPKRADSIYPYRALAGVGVAYTLARALAIRQARHDAPNFAPEDYLDLVALGTVADLVPLTGENRYLATQGLAALNQTQRPGIRALMDVAGVKPGKANASSIGFRLGPRINAAGRLEHAMLAYTLLMTDDGASAAELAQQLQEINERRQEMTGEMQSIASAAAGLDDSTRPPLVFAMHPEFHQGIVGLVASRLAEEAYRPAVVLEQGTEFSHASCRSIPEFSIIAALDRCADLLVRHGGHAAAAGFTVANDNIDALRMRLLDIAEEMLDTPNLTPTLHIDIEASLEDISEDLIAQMQQLEPTGIGNEAPVLCTRGLRVTSHRGVGHEKNHLKMRVFDGKRSMDAIAFRWGHMAPHMPAHVDLAYRPEINEWRGRRSIQLFVYDIQASEG